MNIKAITTCSIDIIEHQQGDFFTCEFNQGLQSAGGDIGQWDYIFDHYQELFPGALIDDIEKGLVDKWWTSGCQKIDNPENLKNVDIGLVIFRLFLDARKEFALHRRYHEYHPIIVDPLSVRAVYKNKAYAAALDDENLFPKTVLVTKDEIRRGVLREYFQLDQKIVIKCPREEATKGTVIAHAGDAKIPLASNSDRFFVVQPVIPTKGCMARGVEEPKHYNCDHRMYLTLWITGDGKASFKIWGPDTNIADFPSGSDRSGAILVNQPSSDGDWKYFIPNYEVDENNERRLRSYVEERVIPYLVEILSNPFNELVTKKLKIAHASRDKLRERVLQDLCNDNQFFSFTEPRPERNHYLRREVMASRRSLLGDAYIRKSLRFG